jgi:hypothetical protein
MSQKHATRHRENAKGLRLVPAGMALFQNSQNAAPSMSQTAAMVSKMIVVLSPPIERYNLSLGIAVAQDSPGFRIDEMHSRASETLHRLSGFVVIHSLGNPPMDV